MKINFYDFLALLYPNRCLICGEYIKANESVCAKCSNIDKIERKTYINFKKNSKMITCYSNYHYIDHYKWAMKRFKFSKRTSYARKFINFTIKQYRDFPFKNYDLICYVPMTKSSEKRRGFNQSYLLAKKLSKKINVPVSNCIEKVKENKIQHRLKSNDRQQNVKDVYKCKEELNGKNIILLDDIITTGATIGECAKTLYEKGANKVVCFTMASTPLAKEK